MKENEAYVILIKSKKFQDCYLGHNDGVMSKIKGAVLYSDEMWANSELNRVVREYEHTNNSFYQKENLSIKKVEINIL